MTPSQMSLECAAARARFADLWTFEIGKNRQLVIPLPSGSGKMWQVIKIIKSSPFFQPCFFCARHQKSKSHGPGAATAYSAR
eukprot:s120_g23.t1